MPTRKRKRSAQDKDRRPATRLVDDIFVFDDSLCERPTAEDYGQTYGAPPREYGLENSERLQEYDVENIAIAIKPKIPNPHDDSRRLARSNIEPCERKRAPRKVRRKAPRKPLRKALGKRARGKMRPTARTQAPKPPESKFQSMPLELREKVYREILVADKYILVHSGWKRVFERKRPGLDTSILRVSKQINKEAERILYGENYFLYRIRDPPRVSRMVTDIAKLVTDDNESEYEYNDDDSDEDEDGASNKTQKRRRRLAETGNALGIDIVKFGSLFRYLVVEAEHNRYSEDTKRTMAQAINVFTARAGDMDKAGKDDRAVNIHTFTVKVSPKREDPSFTFVDFFTSNSPVLDALKALSCQFLRIDVATKYLKRQLPGTGLVCRHSMNMRYRRLVRRATRHAARQGYRGTGGGSKAFRPLDHAMAKFRNLQADESLRALHHVHCHVLECCLKHAPEAVEPDEDWEMDFYEDDDGLNDDFWDVTQM